MIAISQYFGIAVRSLFPFLLCIALLIVELLPLDIAHFAALMPHLMLAGAFFWMINRPNAVPNSVLFLLGLTHDVMTGNLIGLMPFTLIAASRFVADQRQIFTGRLFVLSWWGFIIVAAAYGLVGWLLANMLLPGSITPTGTAVKTLMTIAAYPIIAFAFGRFQRWALD